MILTKILRMPELSTIPIWQPHERNFYPKPVSEIPIGSIVLLHRLDTSYEAIPPLSYTKSIMVDRLVRCVVSKVATFEDCGLQVKNASLTLELPNLYFMDQDKTVLSGADIWFKYLSMKGSSTGYPFNPLCTTTAGYCCGHRPFVLQKSSDPVTGMEITLEIVETDKKAVYGSMLYENNLISMCVPEEMVN